MVYALFDNLAESTAITTTNGNGDDFTSVATGLTAAAAAHPWVGVGAMGAKRTITGTASQSFIQYATATGTLTTRVVGSFWLKIPSGAAVTTNAVLASIDTHATGSQACQIKLSTTLKLRLAPSSTEIGAGASDSNTLSTNTWYFVCWAATANTATNNGIAELYVRDMTGASVMPSGPYANSAVDCKQAELGRLRFGGLTTAITTGWTDEYMTDLQFVRLASGWPDPLPRATAKPQAVSSSSGWTATGAANVAVAMQDASDTTYGEATTGVTDLTLNSITPLGSGTLSLDHQYATALPATRQVDLVEGSTVRKTWNVTPTTSWATASLTLDSTAAGTITNWSWLKLRLTAA